MGATETTSHLKLVPLGRHVVISLVILLLKKKLMKKSPTKPRLTQFFDARFAAEDEGDAETATSHSKLVQLDRHVVTSLVILLLKKSMKKSPLLTKKPRLTQFFDARFAAEDEGGAETVTSLLKLVQRDRHVVTDLVILLMKLKKRPLLEKTPFSDAYSDVAETAQNLKLTKSLESRAQGEAEAATTDVRTRQRKRLKNLQALHVVNFADDAPDVWKRPFQTVQLRSLD